MAPTTPLYLLFTPALCRGVEQDADAPWTVLRAALDSGVGLVQLRMKADDGVREARKPIVRAALDRTLAVCDEFRVPLIVNDHVDLAAVGGAAGAHVGQDDMAAAQARALLRPDQWLGVSTHDLLQLRAAEAEGADHVGFGPCFPTATKGYRQGQPSDLVATIAATATVPVYFLGGLNADRIRSLRDLGAQRFALSGAILGAANPGRATAELLAAAC